MKAIAFHQGTRKLEIRELPLPEVGGSDVRIRLKAAALNHRDLWLLKGRRLAGMDPVILGSDGSGTVEETGKNVTKFKQGEAVIINPSLNWGPGNRVQAKDYQILGFPSPGTFSEFITVDETCVHSKPSHLSFHESAAVPLAGLTAYRALFNRGGLVPGNTVLVTGIGGGAALFAMRFAITAGASTYVTSGDDTKISRALELGATGGVNYRQEHWKEDLQQMADGFDVIIDSAAGNGFPVLLELARPGGRIALFGRTAGAIPEVDPRTVFWKQLSIHGTTMGSPEEFSEMIRWISTKRLKPVIDSVVPAAEINRAFDKMERGEQFGKIVIDLDIL